MVTPPHRAADQAQYMPAGTSSLADIADWARQHLAEPIQLRDLAARACLSERQLTRRFLREFGRAPGDWLTRERLRRAQELLETTALTIDTIANQSGLGTAVGLRAAFAKHLHTSSRDYRLAWAD